MKNHRIFFFLLLSLIIQNMYCSYKVNYFTADNGLSRNFVSDIIKDSNGFIWISTSRGIDRFDGYDFQHFEGDDFHSGSLLRVVNCMEEDINGNLWIGAENGLFIYDYKTGQVFSVSSKYKTNFNYNALNIKYINEDDSGKMWVVSNLGLSYFNISKKNEQGETIVLRNPSIEVVQFSDLSIFVGDNRSVYRLIAENNGKYKAVELNESLKNLEGQVNTMFVDRNFLWIGTSTGLLRFDTETEEIRNYINIREDQTSISSNSITDITKNQNGEILVGTLIGLNVYNYTTDNFKRITTETVPASEALNNNFISSLLVDGNSVWVGTEKGGVNQLIPGQDYFTNVIHSDKDPYSLSKNPVNTIFEDRDGDLFVGTVEGGLNIRKKGSNGFIHAVSDPGKQNSLQHNSVSAVCQDFNNDYWIGTWGNGISRLKYRDKYKPVFQILNKTQENNSVSSYFIAAIIPDDKNRGIWIGTREGLDFFDIQANRYYSILKNLPLENAIKLVTGLFIDSNNRLWAGTGNGLYCIYLNQSQIRSQKFSYRHFNYLLTKPESKIIEKINCIYEAKNKKLWFGSNGNGLYSFEFRKGEIIIKKFDEENGLPDNVIYGILEDAAGTLWCSTDKGICAYNPEKNHFRSFTTVDGLATNQFYWDAFFKGRDEKIYFGNMSGYTVFNPLRFIPATEQNKVEITKISVLNETVFPYQKTGQRKFLQFEKQSSPELILRESDKAFSIEFSAMNFSFPDKIKYAYRLKGFDKAWKEVTADRRFASFTNIKNGNYDLEIKCTNADGSWSEKLFTLKIKVIPPFYKTWWFILVIILTLISSVFSYYRRRLAKLREQENHLRQLVEIRTQEIEQQKKQLEIQAQQLKTNMKELILHQDEVSRQNEKLIEQNRHIKLQNDELEKLTRKLEEVTIDKIAFFTNITHEFRTPITLILGPVERALKLSTNPKVLEQLNIVRRNSKLLLTLINQLMDFRKVESGKMELSKTNQNFPEFLEDIILPFEDIAKDRGIVFIKNYRINSPEFLFDRNNLQKVIGNLLSNAIKFTPDNGIITITTGTFNDKKEHQEKLFFTVKDSGKGINEEEKEKIFERYYQSAFNSAYSGTGQSGTGIGLYLCKQIIELHQGSISAMNLQSGGACFRFIIPIERKRQDISFPEVIPTESEKEISEKSQQDDEELLHNKPVLLIVEDNSDMRRYIRSVLADKFSILEAQNGVAGLEATNRYQPDLIISDVMMPEMDGIEFCRKVKTNFVTSHIPVILLTAKSSVETQIDSFQQGADAFVVKPFDEELLKAIISNLQEKRKRLQMNFAESMNTEALNFGNESPDKKFIEKAMKVLKENYKNPDFEVPELIDLMNISRSLLHKKLTNITGQSASRFIRIYRLNIARELILMNRDTHAMNISEIAYEVGFRDPKYFTRCFTKHFGIQPSAFMDKENDGNMK